MSIQTNDWHGVFPNRHKWWLKNNLNWHKHVCVCCFVFSIGSSFSVREFNNWFWQALWLLYPCLVKRLMWVSFTKEWNGRSNSHCIMIILPNSVYKCTTVCSLQGNNRGVSVKKMYKFERQHLWMALKEYSLNDFKYTVIFWYLLVSWLPDAWRLDLCYPWFLVSYQAGNLGISNTMEKCLISF